MKAKGIKKLVSEAFEIPSEAVGAGALTTLIGREKVIIENTKGVAKYEGETLRINTDDGMMEIEGENLTIKVMSDVCIVCEGSIKGIKFI